MSRVDPPPPSELPSTRALVRSTVWAALAAGLLIVVAVLPAEVGIDPTGAGRLIGLTQMGEVKRELADATAATAATETASAAMATALLADATGPVETTDTTRVEIAPGADLEVKLVMRADAHVAYSWSTDRGTVGYDLHGGPDAATSESYKSDAGAWSDQGTLTAGADGLHGWYWKNETDQSLTITLRTDGDYLDVVRLD